MALNTVWWWVGRSMILLVQSEYALLSGLHFPPSPPPHSSALMPTAVYMHYVLAGAAFLNTPVYA